MPQLHSNNVGRLAAGAAVGFVAGLALPHARKAMMQGPSVAAGDWMAGLKAEHRLVEKAFEAALQTTEGDIVKREMLLTKIAYLLTKHAVEEENVIYPALAEHGHADQAREFVEDHRKTKAFIYELRTIPADDIRWRSTLQGFFTELQTHIREEEDEIFPRFEQELSREQNARITRMMNWEGYKAG